MGPSSRRKGPITIAAITASQLLKAPQTGGLVVMTITLVLSLEISFTVAQAARFGDVRDRS